MISFLKRLRKISVERCEEKFFKLHAWNVLEWAGATAGECGEMANVAKKLRRHEVMVQQESETWWYKRHEKKQEKLRQHLADEVADTIIYLDLLCASQGIDLEEAIKKKFNETSTKIGYKRKFK